MVDPADASVQSSEIVLAYPNESLHVVRVESGSLWGDNPLVVKAEARDGRVILVAGKPGEPARSTAPALSVVFEVTGAGVATRFGL